jgi:hypothetical protein
MPALAQCLHRLAAKTPTEWRRSVAFPWDHAGELSQAIVHLGTEAAVPRFCSEPESNPTGIRAIQLEVGNGNSKHLENFQKKSELTSHVQR